MELRFTSATDPAYLDLFSQAMARRGVYATKYDMDRLARDVYRLVDADNRVVSAEFMLGHLPDGVVLDGALPAYLNDAAANYAPLPAPGELDGGEYVPADALTDSTGLTHAAWIELVAGLRAMIERLTGDASSAYRVVDLAVDLLDHSSVAPSTADPRAFARRVAGSLGLAELTRLCERYAVRSAFRWDGDAATLAEVPGAPEPLLLSGNAF